jgi:hypothetical protein
MKFTIITREQQTEILTDNYKKFEWGWFYPEGASEGVGARLIISSRGLEILPDRVSLVGEDRRCAKLIKEKRLVTALHKFITTKYISSGSDTVIHGVEGDFQILATPNGSYGYVYFSCWFAPQQTTKEVDISREVGRVIQFAYNLDYNRFLEVMGISDDYYAKDKFHQMQNNFMRWYCSLDLESSQKFCKTAKEMK